MTVHVWPESTAQHSLNPKVSHLHLRVLRLRQVRFPNIWVAGHTRAWKYIQSLEFQSLILDLLLKPIDSHPWRGLIEWLFQFTTHFCIGQLNIPRDNNIIENFIKRNSLKPKKKIVFPNKIFKVRFPKWDRRQNFQEGWNLRKYQKIIGQAPRSNEKCSD